MGKLFLNLLSILSLISMSDRDTDEVLLSRIAHHDVDAFSKLYDRYATAVYNIIFRLIRERTLSDELLQETFWIVWQRAEQYEGRGSAAGWLMRIARNNCLDELRRQKARPLKANLTESKNQNILKRHIDEGAEVEEHLVIKRLRQQLHEAMGTLPDDQQTCLRMAYFDGLSHSEIAHQLDVPLGTVKSRVWLGMQKLELFFHHLEQPPKKEAKRDK